MHLNLFKWFLYNLIGKFIPPLAGVLTIPYLLNAMGTELFGEFGALMTVLLLLSILDFGITKSIVKDVASVRQGIKDDAGSYSSVFWQSYFFQFVIGILGASLLLLISYFSGWQDKARLIDLNSGLHLTLILISIPIIVASGVSRAFLEGKNKFKELNLIRAFFSIAVYLSPLFSVYVIGENSIVVLLTLGIKVLESVTLTLFVCTKEGFFRRSELSFRYVKLLMPFGVWVMFSNIISPAVAYGERFVVVAVNGMSSFSSYYIAIELVTKSLIIVSALATASFSIESRLNSNNSSNTQVAILKYIVVFFYTIISLFLYFEGEWLLTYWLGVTDAQQLATIVSILSVGLIFNAVSYTLLNTVYSKGRSFQVFISYLLQLPVYLLAVYFAAKNWGTIGVALIWVIRVAVDFIVLWILSSSKFFVNKGLDLARFVLIATVFAGAVFLFFYFIAIAFSIVWYRLCAYMIFVGAVLITGLFFKNKDKRRSEILCVK